MSENPLEFLFQTFTKISSSVQTNLSKFIRFPDNNSKQKNGNDPLFPFLSSSSLLSHSNGNLSSSKVTGSSLLLPTEQVLEKEKIASPVAKEELGRATWTFLHTLAAQYPDNPTRQQKKDVKELMAILSRMYPCRECADHFKEVLRANPVQAGSHQEFAQWLCHVHNVVNRSLNKRIFPCERVDARWGKLECEQRACDLLGTTTDIGSEMY